MKYYNNDKNIELSDTSVSPLKNTIKLKDTNIQRALSKMILSASGWRTVFVESQKENDTSNNVLPEYKVLSAIIAKAFSIWFLDYFSTKNELGKIPEIVVGLDTRPTGPTIADIMIRVFVSSGIKVNYVYVASAPEIMAYAKQLDGFVYISASHNPVGHNGIKFGLNNGGVIDADKSNQLITIFKDLCNQSNLANYASNLMNIINEDLLNKVFSQIDFAKSSCLDAYLNFTKEVIVNTKNENISKDVFTTLSKSIQKNNLGIVADFNGSARILSIDKTFYEQNKIDFYSINNQPGKFAHAIIPEPENLVFCANYMQELHNSGLKNVLLGYMPDCDGDRGNIVYWSANKAKILKAQEVFSLSVLSELSFCDYLQEKYPKEFTNQQRNAIAVNDPTSMRIEEIAQAFNASVYRAEVGEANVVNLARNLRDSGFIVRILGEGSNGGTITHPAAVRDPINTIFALIKLLCIRDETYKGKTILGLFHRWCVKSNQENLYKENFTLDDVVQTLPLYITTGVSESRAVLHIQTKDHSVLKAKYQTIFEELWKTEKDKFKENYGITSWIAYSNNGTKQTDNLKDFSVSGKGGLKIIFYNDKKEQVAFIWMRGSGTEPVFRVMCDVKGSNPRIENELLAWHTKIIQKADVA